MYIHVDSQDHKNIAGIAYLQSKLKELNPNIKIDGMFGAESIAAFRDAIEEGLGIDDFRVDLQGVGISLIQFMIRQAVTLAKRKDFPVGRLHDGEWGDGTKDSIDLILGDMCALKQLEKVKELLVGKRVCRKLTDRTLKHIKSRVNPSMTPLAHESPNVLKQGTHWCCGMEFEVNAQTDVLLAKALGYENPVATIHQMLAAGYQIAIEYYKGRAVAIIVVRPFEYIPSCPRSSERTTHKHESETNINGMIEGIYVNIQMRGNGIGTRLLCAVKFKGQELEWNRIVFVQGPPIAPLGDRVCNGVHNPKERIFDQLINGHGYKAKATALDDSRPESCFLDLNKR